MTIYLKYNPSSNYQRSSGNIIIIECPRVFNPSGKKYRIPWDNNVHQSYPIHIYVYIYIPYSPIQKGYSYISYWLVVLTILKNIGQREGLSHIWNGSHKSHVPSHQPGYMSLKSISNNCGSGTTIEGYIYIYISVIYIYIQYIFLYSIKSSGNLT